MPLFARSKRWSVVDGDQEQRASAQLVSQVFPFVLVPFALLALVLALLPEHVAAYKRRRYVR